MEEYMESELSAIFRVKLVTKIIVRGSPGTRFMHMKFNESSAWTTDQIDGLCIDMSNCEPLLGGSYIPLPKVLKNSMKGLINLKNKDHKCFIWCHVRLINLTNSQPERINKQDKKIDANLNYQTLCFSRIYFKCK